MPIGALLAAGGITLCAQFGLFPDNHQMGPSFELAGYVFRDLGSPTMFVNQTGGELGLQFSKTGVSVALPSASPAVDLRVGAFAGPVTVTAKDLTGAVVASQTVPGVNRFLDIRLVAPEIATFELTDGTNEGILAKACVSLAVCQPCGRVKEPPRRRGR